MIIEKIAGVLKESYSIAIMAHVSPDGDSIGSMLALYNALNRMGKRVDVYQSDNIPPTYSFLPGISLIKKCGTNEGSQYDAAVILDSGGLDRIGDCIKLLDNINLTINIDHHITSSEFAHYNLIDPKASSTGELIYRLIKGIGLEVQKDEAICLYTAILTDTGCFKYPSTTPETHRIAADLISCGIEFWNIHDMIYGNYDYNTVRIMGKVMKGMELSDGGKVVIMQLLHEDLEGLRLEDIDTTDFISYGRDISSVEVAAFIKQTSQDEYKVSFRSKSFVDVRKICEKFGGGGHIRASGCTLTGNLKSVKDTVLAEIRKSLKGEIH